MNRSRWSTVLFTVVVVLLVEVAAGLIYIYSGSYNVGAADDLEPLSRWVFSTTTMRSIRAHGGGEGNVLPQPVPQHMLEEGAEHYGEMCVGCHGAPGRQPSAFISKGITPAPPNLKEAVEEFSDGELYWILQNGIKHSAMPAMGPTHSKEKIQAVTAFIKQLPDMSPQQYEAMGGSGEGGHEHGEEGHEHGEPDSTSAPPDSSSIEGGHGGPGHSH